MCPALRAIEPRLGLEQTPLEDFNAPFDTVSISRGAESAPR
jgi:hypothetical protein